MSWWGGKGEQKAQIKRIALKKVLKESQEPQTLPGFVLPQDSSLSSEIIPTMMHSLIDLAVTLNKL